MTIWRTSVYAVRYVTGRPLDGRPRTDAGFLRAGTRAFTITGRASRWSMLPGWKRALWRVGTPVALASGTITYVTHPRETVMYGGALASLAGLEVGRRTHRRLQHRRHRRQFVNPLHRTLERVLGVSGLTADQWLSIPTNFEQDDVESVLHLPKDLHPTAEVKRIIRDVVCSKLGLSDPDFAWHTIGSRPYVAWRPAPKPPARVPWGFVAEAARKAPDTAPVIGSGPRGSTIDVDLVADSPHVLVSAGSGGGKSVLVRTLVAQGLNRGAGVVILDFKRQSHAWADGLPGVAYCRDIAEIHDALVELGREGERRMRAADHTGEFDGYRILIVAEEMNATITKLRSYWAKIRTSDDPKGSPAVDALLDVLFMGRAAKMNVIAVAQMMTARTIGGPEARENFATRCLTRCTTNAMKMLVPEVMPMKAPKGLGRWLIVRNGEPTECQVAFMTPDEAQHWARAGVPNPGTVLTVTTHATQEKQAGTVLPLPLGDAGDPGRLVGLREAATLLPGRPLSLEALRKAKQRRRYRFPEPVGQDGPEAMYRLTELIEWKTRVDAVRIVNGATA